MRALLVVNPAATSTTERGRDVLTRALASDLEVEVAETRNRGHAAALACRAAREGLELVVALGGDGTVNEVVNGLLTDGPRPGLPSLGVVPGGSTNVFARVLGISNNPVEATGQIHEALHGGRSRSVGLGMANDRYFTFGVGVGFDAEVVHRIEKQRRRGRNPSNARYVRAAVTHFYLGTDRRHPAITVEVEGEEPATGVHFAIVSNCSPWTFLGNRPVNPSPAASFDTGLDLFGPTRMGTVRLLRLLRQALRKVPGEGTRHVLRRHDLSEFTMICERPLSLEVDGDYLGEYDKVHFRAVPDALRVLV